jgi:adenylate kinase family enzyme
MNDPFVKKVIMLGSEIAVAFASYSENPTWWGGIKTAFMTGKALVEQFEVLSYEFFEDENQWIEPFPRDFTGAILKVLKKYPYETLKTSSEGSVIHIVTLDEGRVGWLTNTKFASFKVNNIYAETSKVDAIREKVKTLLWEQFKGKPLVLRKNIQTLRSYDEDRVVLEIDDAFHPLPSKLADEYTKYLKRAIDGGVNRSVMLYGPPGTGKSTLARTLVNELNLRSFRIRIEDVGGIDNSTLFEAIDIFKPDAIILDDFDRAGGQEQLLETLEHFERNIKLVIATVNRRDNLDEALLRPGRFDELILVKRMDDNVIKKVLGEHTEVFDKVKDWPIAFIQEYIKRRRFMNKTEAMKSIKELAERVERLGEYDDDRSDAEKILANAKKAIMSTKKSKGRKRSVPNPPGDLNDPLWHQDDDEG